MASYRDDYSARTISTRVADQPNSELIAALRQLYRASEHSDLKIVLQDGSKISVHRAIVCPRSAFLAKAVREGDWNDSNEGEIALLDETPELVSLVFEYLYLLDYIPPPRSPSAASDDRSQSHDSDTLSVRTEAMHFGHMYGTSAISAFGGPRDSISAQSPFNPAFGTHQRNESQLTVHALPGVADYAGLRPDYNNRRASGRSQVSAVGPPDASPLATKEPNLVIHARVYAAAQKYGIAGLKSLALDKFKIQLTRHWDSIEFAEAIHVVYTLPATTDKDMRECVADTIGWHRTLLDKPEVEVAIMDINGLAYELLKRARRAEPEF